MKFWAKSNPKLDQNDVSLRFYEKSLPGMLLLHKFTHILKA